MSDGFDIGLIRAFLAGHVVWVLYTLILAHLDMLVISDIPREGFGAIAHLPADLWLLFTAILGLGWVIIIASAITNMGFSGSGR